MTVWHVDAVQGAKLAPMTMRSARCPTPDPRRASFALWSRLHAHSNTSGTMILPFACEQACHSNNYQSTTTAIASDIVVGYAYEMPDIRVIIPRRLSGKQGRVLLHLTATCAQRFHIGTMCECGGRESNVPTPCMRSAT